MENRLELKKLILKGIRKDYPVTFKPGLNIVEGKISTGKTAIFGFIDYCFGSKTHPIHPEIERNVRSVLLEIQINNICYVIERPLFSSDSKINLHECALEEMGENHNVISLSSRHQKDQPSLSIYLLNKLNLFDISLKEALKKDLCDTDTLSFRDLMWFCYLKAERLDNRFLLFENEPMKNIKLRQVFEIIFKIHENEIAILTKQIKELDDRLKEINREIEKIDFFLKERKIPSKDTINLTLTKLDERQTQLKEKLSALSSTLKGKSGVADHLRVQLDLIEQDVRRLQTIKRSLDTLLKRLLPLRGQYSEDIKKLYFLQDAKIIFNPLNITRCPICLENLEESKDKSKCICGNEIKINNIENFDVLKEIRSIESKLKELNGYISESSDELDTINVNIEEKNKEIISIKGKIDDSIKDFVSPYISERDDIVGELNRIEQQIQDMQVQVELHKGMDKRIILKGEIECNLKNKQLEYQKLKETIIDKSQILEKVNKRYQEILAYINLPKLSDARIDDKLVPYFRGIPYREVGSLGAMTLISTTWFLSIYENAIELDGDHPGFIMLDSPQKDIGIRPSDNEDEYRDTRIIEKLYEHIIQKSNDYGNKSQIIIVDNEPPLFAQEYVIVKYSRNKDLPPYGLIDDDTEC